MIFFLFFKSNNWSKPTTYKWKLACYCIGHGQWWFQVVYWWTNMFSVVNKIQLADKKKINIDGYGITFSSYRNLKVECNIVACLIKLMNGIWTFFHSRFINTVTVKYMELQCSDLSSNSVYDVKMFKQYNWWYIELEEFWKDFKLWNF